MAIYLIFTSIALLFVGLVTIGFTSGMFDILTMALRSGTTFSDVGSEFSSWWGRNSNQSLMGLLLVPFIMLPAAWGMRIMRSFNDTRYVMEEECPGFFKGTDLIKRNRRSFAMELGSFTRIGRD